MGFGFLRNRPKYVDAQAAGQSHKTKSILIVIITVSIIILLLSGTKKDKNDLKPEGINTENHIEECRRLTEENEKRLEEILSRIQGAGEVKVMISVEEINEQILAIDKKSEVRQDTEKEKSSQTKNQEQKVIVYGSGSDEKPYVVKEKLPLPSGVLVVAAGADNEVVKQELYEAVRALYGVAAHRVKITKASVK